MKIIATLIFRATVNASFQNGLKRRETLGWVQTRLAKSLLISKLPEVIILGKSSQRAWLKIWY